MPNRAPTTAVVELLDRVHNLTGREPGTFTPSQVMTTVSDHLAPRVKVGQPIDEATVRHYASVLTERSRNRGKASISFLYLAVVGHPVLPYYVNREVGLFLGRQLQNLTELSQFVHPDQIERRKRYGHAQHLRTVFEPFEGAVREQDHRRENESNVKREKTYSDIRQHFVHSSETDRPDMTDETSDTNETGEIDLVPSLRERDRADKTDETKRSEALAEAMGYQVDALNLTLNGGNSEDPDRIAKATRTFVDPRLAHLITGEIYESNRKSLIDILAWIDRNGVTPSVITSIREHVAGGLIIAGERLMKHVTPTEMVMSAIIPAIESVIKLPPTESNIT